MSRASATQIPVTSRALIQRVNRRLAHEQQGLKQARTERVRQDLGDFYLVDFTRNFVIDKHVDLEGLGRDLGVLRPYERLEEPE